MQASPCVMLQLTCVMLKLRMVKLTLQYGQAYARHASAYVTVWWSLRNSNGNPRPACSCLPMVMLKLTLLYGQAYVTVTSAFVLCSLFVLTGEHEGTNREQTQNKPWTWGPVGVAAPPAIGRGPDTDAPLHLTDIPKISPKPFSSPLYISRKHPYMGLTHAAAWKQTRNNL